MLFCIACRFLNYCQKISTPLVTDSELGDPEFVRGVRATAFDEGVAPDAWLEHVSDLYRDYPGWIVGSKQTEAFLNMGVFERPHIREWFRDFCCTACPADARPRVRKEARERVRVLATILRATYPVRAQTWGLPVANDNRAPEDYS